MHRIGDVEQNPVARAGTGGQADVRKHRDVVTRPRDPGALRSRAVVAPLPQAGERAGRGIGEDARLTDDARFLGGGQWDLNHVDAEERRVGILLRIFPGAACELVRGSHDPSARHVHVQVASILRIGHERVGV